MRRLLCLIVLFIAACPDPEPPDGAVRCSPSGECPRGYECLGDTCWRKGTDLSQLPDAGTDASTDSGADASTDSGTDAGADASAPVDMTPPKLQNGQSCTANEQCDSNHCVDGVCCDSACTGQCEACNLAGSEGTCAAVLSGLPRGSRQPCAGVGTSCGGVCDGKSRTACTYPGTQTICGATCNGKCNGAGQCDSAAGGTCPGGFACGTSGCKTSCSTASDCQPNFTCNAPNCVRVPESDCLDGIDNNGDGLADCADPTCTSVVCVPDPGAGTEVGTLLDDGTCPSDYGPGVTYHKDLVVPDCTGCGCSTDVSCAIDIAVDTSTNSCGSKVSLGTFTSSMSGATCKTFGPVSGIKSFIPTNVRVTASSCAPSGTAMRGTPTWQTHRTFCGAGRTSSSCGAGKKCVRKLASGSVCARVPNPGAGCPVGYTTGASSAYYTGFTDGRSCTACQCTVTSATCTSDEAVILFSTYSNGCPGSGGGAASAPANQCGKTPFCLFVCPPAGAFASPANAGSVGSFGMTGTCNASTNVQGTVTPTGGSMICCQ